MKFVKFVIVFLSSLLIFVSCGDTDSADQDAAPLSSVDGNSFVFEVDRISETPDVQFPMDDLQESNYEELNENTDYNVAFSENGQIVSIEPESVQGQKINNGVDSITYELDEGAFAGGRFVVWTSNDRLEAELTIYGSGIPILKSERGILMQPQ